MPINQKILDQLTQNDPNLVVLQLGKFNYYYGSEEGKATISNDKDLETLIKALEKNHTIKRLIFASLDYGELRDSRHRPLGDKGLEELSKILKSNTSLIELDLQQNNITTKGLKQLITALEQNNTLKVLKLGCNSGIDSEGIRELSGILKNKSLISLDLHDIPIDKAGVTYLKDALIDKNVFLERLDLWDCDIRDEGVSEISKALEVNTSIKWLSLSGNRIDDRGILTLSAALKKNHTLKTLYLSDNSFGDEGAIDLISALEENRSLITIMLGKYWISDSKQKEIEAWLQYNRTGQNPPLKNKFDASAEIRNRIRDLLDQYTEDNFKTTAIKKLIHETVNSLLGREKSSLSSSLWENKENVNKYNAHLLALEGKKVQKGKKINLEGFWVDDYIPMRIRVFLELFVQLKTRISLTNGALIEIDDKADPEALREKLMLIIAKEIISDITTFKLRELAKDYYLCSLTAKPDKLAFSKAKEAVLDQILKLQPQEEFLCHSGYTEQTTGHTFYVMFERNKDHIVIRIDNLGDGCEYHKKNGERVQPYMIGCFSLDHFKQKTNLHNYLEGLIKAKPLEKNESFKRIYNKNDHYKLKMLSNPQFEKEIESNWLDSKQQTVGNCVVANRQPALKFRSLKVDPTDPTLGKELYKYIRKLEVTLVAPKIKDTPINIKEIQQKEQNSKQDSNYNYIASQSFMPPPKEVNNNDIDNIKESDQEENYESMDPRIVNDYP